MNGQSEQRNDEPTDKDEIVEDVTDSPQAADTDESIEEDPQALLQAKADENWDKYLRAAAELENVRKRASRDVDNARKFAVERFAAEMLAVRDSLELGLQADTKADAEQLTAGSEATLKLLSTSMERFGVVEVDPQGEPFDPELHEAITMQPSGDVEPGTVLTVFQKGYTLNGRLLRPARVVVAQEPADGADSAKEEA